VRQSNGCQTEHELTTGK